jgi:4-hydroxy-tetrahydrodipicolinate synthase
MSRLPAGNYAIILTPLDETGALDLNGLAAELEYVIAKKVRGAVVLGSNGEGPFLTGAEKARVIKRAGEVAKGRITLVAGSITMGTNESLEYAALAKSAGFDSILAAIPQYFHLDFADVKRHYEKLAAESPVEITLYYVPECTGLVLSPEQIAELCGIPGVDSMKLTVMNREFISKTMELCWEKDCQVFLGTSLLLFEAMKLDAKGAFCPLCMIAADDMNELFRLITEKKWTEAFEIQEKVRRAGATLFSGQDAPYDQVKDGFIAIYNAPFLSQVINHLRVAHNVLKEVLRLKGIPITNQVRLPYLRVDQQKSQWAKRVLKDFNWL